MNTLEDLINAMESLYPVGPSTIISRSMTGEPYISFCLGGKRSEGMTCGVWATTEKDAINAFWLAFQEYAVPRVGVLYWRRKPEFHAWEVEEDNFDSLEGGKRKVILLNISARFLISNAPQIASTEKELYEQLSKL